MKKTLTSILATIPLITGSCSNQLNQETPEIIALNNYSNLVENYFEARNGKIELDEDITEFLREYTVSNATEVEKILIKNMYRHDRYSVSTPPRIGPMKDPAQPIPQMAIALGCSSSGNASNIIARDKGTKKAPHIP